MTCLNVQGQILAQRLLEVGPDQRLAIARRVGGPVGDPRRPRALGGKRSATIEGGY